MVSPKPPNSTKKEEYYFTTSYKCWNFATLSYRASLKNLQKQKSASGQLLFGVSEPDKNLPVSSRQAYTESVIAGLLDALDIETRPVEIHRIGNAVEGKPRLVKCILPPRRHYFEILLRAQSLRTFCFQCIRMFREEIDDQRKARERQGAYVWRARELNQKKHNGERIYVVYKGELTKDRAARKGGGVCVLIHNLLLYENISFKCNNLAADVICFDILLPLVVNIVFLLIYRPPNSNSVQDDLLLSVIYDLTSATPIFTAALGDLNLVD
ncbi:hypothetical protein COOONC_12646 [Cooperia oncophora]